MQSRLNSFFTRHEWLIPLLLVVLFMAVSLPGVGWGAPQLWNPDELIRRVHGALRGELVFDVNEADFNYPSLPKYVMYAIGSVTFGLGRSDFAFFVAARSFSALLGALAGALVYYMARMLGANKRMAALAGALYVLSGVAAANGRFAHNDLYLQFFTILCVMAVLKYQLDGEMRWLYAAFFAVGLAASSKYTGGSLILLPIVACLVKNASDLRVRWLPVGGSLLLGGLVSYLGYGIGTPKSLTEPITYFSAALPFVRNFAQYGFNSGASIGLFGQWAVFESAVGTFAYYLFIVAFAWFSVKLVLWKLGRVQLDARLAQGAVILIAVVLIFDLPFLISINYIERYFIPFVPFMAVLAAFFVWDVYQISQQKGWQAAPFVIVAGLSAGAVYSILRLVSIALLFLNDARIPATDFIADIRGYQKSIEYTLYPPNIEKRRFMRSHNYPIYFVKYPGEVVPGGGQYEFNLGEQGLLERNTDYFVIDSYTYDRFYTDSICETNPVECAFFKQLLEGESKHYRLLKKFDYELPPWLPHVFISAVNPDVLVFERVR
jgi:hypothetical protein